MARDANDAGVGICVPYKQLVLNCLGGGGGVSSCALPGLNPACTVHVLYFSVFQLNVA